MYICFLNQLKKIFMARVSLAPIIADLSGKLANAVFTRGRSVLAIRTRVRPGNPQTGFQTLIRGYFKQFTTAFRSLTESQIAVWNNISLQWKKNNIFGDNYATTGHKLFVAQNTTNCMFGDGAQINAPIDPIVPSTITIESPDFDSSPQKVEFELMDAVPANTKLLIFATPQMSAGVSAYKNKFTHIQTFDAGETAGVKGITTLYCAKYGDVVQNQKIAIQAYLTNTHATKKVIKFKAGAELSAKVK
jgi:hypothetical protein